MLALNFNYKFHLVCLCRQHANIILLQLLAWFFTVIYAEGSKLSSLLNLAGQAKKLLSEMYIAWASFVASFQVYTVVSGTSVPFSTSLSSATRICDSFGLNSILKLSLALLASNSCACRMQTYRILACVH